MYLIHLSLSSVASCLHLSEQLHVCVSLSCLNSAEMMLDLSHRGPNRRQTISSHS